MVFDAIRFLKDYDIPFSTEHHHARPEWTAVKVCPFCYSTNYHFGINKTDGRCYCWKCGSHPLISAVKRMCGGDFSEAHKIIDRYGDGVRQSIRTKIPRREEGVLKPISLPEGTGKLRELHRRYLEKRNFDSYALEHEWKIKGTGLVIGSQHSMRIIIPITHNRVVVSYQGRDVTGDERRLRYKTCDKKDESRFHKHCLYGLDKIKGDTVVVTEGVTKVWRLGIGAVATFGIIWDVAQAGLLLDFKRVFILFDKGEQAQIQADRLARLLAGNISHVEIITLDNYSDPGDMPQDEADNMMKELGIKK